MLLDLHDFVFGNDFLYVVPKVQVAEEKDKFDFIKIKTFVCQETLLESKMTTWEQTKHLQIMCLIREQYPQHINNS